MKTSLYKEPYTPQETAMLQDIMRNNKEVSDVLRFYGHEVGLTDTIHIRFKDISRMISDLTLGAMSPGYTATRSILGFVLHEINSLIKKGMLEEGSGLHYRNDEELKLIRESEEVYQWLLKQ